MRAAFRGARRVCAALLLLFPHVVLASDLANLPDAGIVDVRAFGAKPDDSLDDTAAIQRAIDSVPVAPGRIFWRTPIVYLPAGTYLLSGTLVRKDAENSFTSGLVLAGDGRGATVLRLADRAPGFTDPAAPKPVVMTSARLLDGDATGGGKDYANKGEGNDAYANYVEDLTIDVGEGNAGAVALDYLANNIGAVRRVGLLGRPGSGVTGLSLARKWIGPALLSDVRIDGFPVGIDVANTEYGIAMEHVAIVGSRVAGLRNAGNLVAADDLRISADGGVAVENGEAGGLLVLNGAVLGGRGEVAIRNAGHLTLSGIEVRGFESMLGAGDGGLREGCFDPDNRYTGEAAWRLPPADPPAPATPEHVANVADFGAVADPAVDSTQAIRAAFASGADTVEFPFGTYMVTDTITVPASVRRVRGRFAAITVGDRRHPGFDRRQDGILRIESDGEPLTVDKLTFDMTDRGGQLAFEHAGRRTLVLEDIVTAGVTLLARRASGGPIFVANACCGGVSVAGRAGVWMRQFNSEAREGVRLTNDGAPVRVLGMKVENEVTAVRNAKGGRTEIVGGFFYPVTPGPARRPLAVNQSGHIALSYVEEAFRADAVYDLHLRSANGADDVHGWMLPARNGAGARIVPFLENEVR